MWSERGALKPRHVVGFAGALMLLGALWAPVAAARPKCGGEPATIVGSDRRDELVGTRRADVIVSRGGNDTIRAEGGADVICAGDGRDNVEAGDGNDQVNGGGGQDRVNGGEGIDACLTSEVLQRCEADPGLDLQGPATMRDNEVADWTFAYSNNGPSPAPGAKLTVTFAPRLTVATLGPGCSEEPVDTVSCQLGTLDLQESGEVVISAQAPSVCSSPQNDTFNVVAFIEASTQDRAPDDNKAIQTTAYADQGC